MSGQRWVGAHGCWCATRALQPERGAGEACFGVRPYFLGGAVKRGFRVGGKGWHELTDIGVLVVGGEVCQHWI